MGRKKLEGFVIENSKLTHYYGKRVHVVIPNNVNSISEHVFERYKNLKSVRNLWLIDILT